VEIQETSSLLKNQIARGNGLLCIFEKHALTILKVEQLTKSSLSFSSAVHIMRNIKFTLAFIHLVFPNTGPSSSNTS